MDVSGPGQPPCISPSWRQAWPLPLQCYAVTVYKLCEQMLRDIIVAGSAPRSGARLLENLTDGMRISVFAVAFSSTGGFNTGQRA